MPANSLTHEQRIAALDRIIGRCEEIKALPHDRSLTHSLQRIENAFAAIVFALEKIKKEGR